MPVKRERLIIAKTLRTKNDTARLKKKEKKVVEDEKKCVCEKNDNDPVSVFKTNKYPASVKCFVVIYSPDQCILMSWRSEISSVSGVHVDDSVVIFYFSIEQRP